MMNLYSRKYDKDYGEIGTETNLIDVSGEPLFIGDLVLLTDDDTGVGKLRFVAHDFEIGADYVMGAYFQSVGLPSGRNATWKKIAGYQNFTNGFRLNELEFVDPSAVNKRQVSFMEDKKIRDLIPETLTWCRQHYVPPVQKYITCQDFGYSDGMNGGCWWCMEMTPYQWHMCQDASWIRSLTNPSRTKVYTKAEAIEFVENRKQTHPMTNERKALLSESD